VDFGIALVPMPFTGTYISPSWCKENKRAIIGSKNCGRYGRSTSRNVRYLSSYCTRRVRRCGLFAYHCASATSNTVRNYVSAMHESYHSNSSAKKKMPRLANPHMTSACAFSKQWVIDNIRGPIRKWLGWWYDSNSTKLIWMMEWFPEVGPFCLETFIPEALTLQEAPLVLCFGEERRLVCHLDFSNTLPSKVLLIPGKESQSFWK